MCVCLVSVPLAGHKRTAADGTRPAKGSQDTKLRSGAGWVPGQFGYCLRATLGGRAAG